MKGWASFELEFGQEVDYKSAGHILRSIEGYTVELEERDRPAHDVNIVNAYETSGDDAGIQVAEITEFGDAKPNTEQFVRYENIKRITIY